MNQTEKKAIEELAELEHKQWAHWTRHMLDNLTERDIRMWRIQIDTPYSKLLETEKESDRVWARKVLEIAIPKDVLRKKINSIHSRLLKHSQITFDNKSIIFENNLEEFDKIMKDLKGLLGGEN